MTSHFRNRGGQFLRAITVAAATFILTACADDPEITAPPPVLTGTVVNAATLAPIAGVDVSIGAAKVTTGGNGKFFFIGLPPGPVSLKIAPAGFEPFALDLTMPSADLVLPDVKLKRIERFNIGNFAVYVPASVPQVDGILLALGGPDTRGFAVGTPFGAPMPAVEVMLQAMGDSLRSLAARFNFAIAGTSTAAMANTPQSDQDLMQALKAAADSSGRKEIATSPILMYGLSGGGPEASGFTARQPEKVLGLFLKSPQDVESLTTAAARAVPTYMVLAELDAFVDNAQLKAKFEANRRAGALWAIAMEPGVPHHFLSPAQQHITLGFMGEVTFARLQSGPFELGSVIESAGWLGNLTTREVAPWQSYKADRGSASWFVSGETADQWRAFTSTLAR